MKMRTFAALVLAMVLTGIAGSALAYVQPKSHVYTATANSTSIYGYSVSKLYLNDGPGTRRFFNELGTRNSKPGERIHILARAWDPNNSIWWIKVEYPTGTGLMGWTGYKRFDASSFDLNSVPLEVWY